VFTAIGNLNSFKKRLQGALSCSSVTAPATRVCREASGIETGTVKVSRNASIGAGLGVPVGDCRSIRGARRARIATERTGAGWGVSGHVFKAWFELFHIGGQLMRRMCAKVSSRPRAA
jgi:hypothetical protein